MLKKLPEYLSRHIDVYESMHRDIDPSEESSIMLFRSR